MNLKITKNQLRSQDGITILLSLMIISAITIITVTVAAFVVQEIRAARSSTLTEPAIIAAESAGEQGIYRIKKGSGSTSTVDSCNTSPDYTNIDGTATASNTKIKKCLTGLGATFTFSDTEPLIFYLYDQTNVNGNLCMERISCPTPNDGNGSGDQLYSQVFITYLSGNFPVNVQMETLDGVVINTGVYGILNNSQQGTYNIDRNILGANDERLKFTLTPTAKTATVEVKTVGFASGLPDFQTIDAEGCVGLADLAPGANSCEGTNEIYKRRINITLPR